jgi:hypothetical protein
MNLTPDTPGPKPGNGNGKPGATSYNGKKLVERGIDQNTNYQLTMPVYLNTSFNNIRRKSLQKS